MALDEAVRIEVISKVEFKLKSSGEKGVGKAEMMAFINGLAGRTLKPLEWGPLVTNAGGRRHEPGNGREVRYFWWEYHPDPLVRTKRVHHKPKKKKPGPKKGSRRRKSGTDPNAPITVTIKGPNVDMTINGKRFTFDKDKLIIHLSVVLVILVGAGVYLF